MELDIANQRVSDGVAVRVSVRLSTRETNLLFVNGDTLIQLPLDGALSEPEGSPIPRSAIFLSELAGLRDGLTRTFADEAAAAAFTGAVRGQLESALGTP